MPLPIPDLTPIIERITSDLSSELIELDAAIAGQWGLAFGQAIGGRIYDLYLYDQQSLDQSFPQTSTDEFNERWLNYQGTTTIPANNSAGDLTITGIVSTLLPLGNVFTVSGVSLTTTTDATIQENIVNITSLTRSGSTVTATTSGDHGMATGNEPTISGAVETEYNGVFSILALTENAFQYDIATTPTTPASGTIISTIDSAIVSVISDDTGEDQNLTSSTTVNLSAVIAGIDSQGIVRPSGVDGGRDTETDEESTARLLDLRANPSTPFNPANIKKEIIDNVDGVTRVFVKRTYNADTQALVVGDVSIFFLRDNDESPIPDNQEILEVRDFVVESMLPAEVALDNLYVKSPIPFIQNFLFASISPDTSSMRSTIELNLIAYFEDTVTFEQVVSSEQYRAVIISSKDDQGNSLQSFVLTTPAGDIDPGTDGIAIVGSVTFS